MLQTNDVNFLPTNRRDWIGVFVRSVFKKQNLIGQKTIGNQIDQIKMDEPQSYDDFDVAILSKLSKKKKSWFFFIDAA